MDKDKLKESIETFPWESQVQKESYLAYLMYRAHHKMPMGTEVDESLAFVFQKTHEQNQYWLETMSDQISQLRLEIKEMGDRAASSGAASKRY